MSNVSPPGFHCVCGKCLPVVAAIPNHDVPDPGM